MNKKSQQDLHHKNSRRAFLKTTMGASALAVGSLALSGCGSKNDVKEGVVQGKSPKKEILYSGDTKYWKTYYQVAK